MISAILFTFFATPLTHANIVESGEYQIQTKVSYTLMELEVKCRAPRWEDDPFTPYFSTASYKTAESYLNQGYFFRLTDRTCGKGGATELSGDHFEKVKVLFVNSSDAEAALQTAIESVISKHF